MELELEDKKLQIDTLPPEVICHIATFLTIKDLAGLTLCNSYLHDTIEAMIKEESLMHFSSGEIRIYKDTFSEIRRKAKAKDEIGSAIHRYENMTCCSSFFGREWVGRSIFLSSFLGGLIFLLLSARGLDCEKKCSTFNDFLIYFSCIVTLLSCIGILNRNPCKYPAQMLTTKITQAIAKLKDKDEQADLEAPATLSAEY